ncbi:molecular chaperone [Burkholderia ubonensis]|uniref:fimbrial biogenesis chaperone n=2 Tax=Burkholderia ubonensis TaxID=101571 RepID=UPI0009B3CD52|nr:fimbria/pilus periplasmic chaperone [Burkholderia ubonensis]
MMAPILLSLFRRFSSSACIMLACVAQQAAATVIVSGTRVVYPAGDREVTVKADNNGTQPALVQAWLDDGDVHSRPGTAKVPFVLMPPVFRIDPGKGQTVRIVYTGEPLPQDRESVFWLNVLDVPPRVEETSSTTALQLAFRSRIKLFFRPVGLDADGAVAAAKQLKWSLAAAPDGKGYALRATNPSPFNVIVLSARIAHGGRTFALVDGAMVAPRQSHVFPLDAPLPALPPGTKLDYSTINDFGTGVPWESTVDDTR